MTQMMMISSVYSIYTPKHLSVAADREIQYKYIEIAVGSRDAIASSYQLATYVCAMRCDVIINEIYKLRTGILFEINYSSLSNFIFG